MKYRPDIDGLRAIAVVPVILFHLGVPGFSGGYVGVDVFFVISGYLITSLIAPEIRRGDFSIFAFYERRVRRIFPALFTVMACTVPVALILLLPSALRSYGQSLVAMTLFASNFLFWHNAGYFDATAHSAPLLHTWSLAVEEQFYIFFPLLLTMLWRYARGHERKVLAALLVLSLGLSAWLVTSDPAGAFYGPHSRAWELLVGCLLALSPQYDLGAITSNVLSALGLTLILFAVFTFTSATPFPGLNALFPALGTALIIRTGNGSNFFFGPLLRARVAVFIGKISYSAYLWHWPIIVFATYYLVRDLHPWEMVAAGILTFVLSVASWHWIEQPARKIRVPRRRIFAVAAAASALLVPVGLVAFVTHGLPGRYAVDPEPPGIETYGVDVCHMFRRPAQAWNEATCTFVSSAGARAPIVFLWGDSFAAHYMPGLRALQKTMQFTLIHASKSGCAPLPNFEMQVHLGTADCEAFNERIFALILRQKPDLVILAGRWDGGSSLSYPRTITNFVLARFKAEHIPTIVVGESPVYSAPVPQIFEMNKLRGDDGRWYRPTNNFWTDPMFREVDRDNGALFFSPHRLLCNRGLCEVSDGQLFYWDEAHFSVHGSTLVVAAMAPLIGQALHRYAALTAQPYGR
jgi:peptidoglycan/LPS O-acetylase OafA/YrhL